MTDASVSSSSFESMTGFAARTAALGSRRLRMVLRSVNHRGLRLHVTAPLDAELAEEVRRRIGEIVRRGAVDLLLDPEYASEAVAGEAQAFIA